MTPEKQSEAFISQETQKVTNEVGKNPEKLAANLDMDRIQKEIFEKFDKLQREGYSIDEKHLKDSGYIDNRPAKNKPTEIKPQTGSVETGNDKLTIDKIIGKELLNGTGLNVVNGSTEGQLKFTGDLKGYKATYNGKEINLSGTSFSKELKISKLNDGNITISSEGDAIKLEKINNEKPVGNGNKSMDEINKMLDGFQAQNKERFGEEKPKQKEPEQKLTEAEQPINTQQQVETEQRNNERKDQNIINQMNKIDLNSKDGVKELNNLINKLHNKEKYKQSISDEVSKLGFKLVSNRDRWLIMKDKPIKVFSQPQGLPDLNSGHGQQFNKGLPNLNSGHGRQFNNDGINIESNNNGIRKSINTGSISAANGAKVNIGGVVIDGNEY